MFFVKKLSFSPSGFFRQTKAKKIVFFDIPDRKEYFLEQKGELFKKCVKNRKFLKGVVHDSCQKNRTVYHVCFFPNQGGKDCLLILWIEKNTF